MQRSSLAASCRLIAAASSSRATYTLPTVRAKVSLRSLAIDLKDLSSRLTSLAVAARVRHVLRARRCIPR